MAELSDIVVVRRVLMRSISDNEQSGTEPWDSKKASRSTAEVWGDLLSRARAAAKHAYAPYSEFPVGAAALALDGSIHTGCNVENASYGLTICAERAAVSAAVGAGHRQIVAVAVSAPKVARTTPCGACRQFLNEFRPANADMVIVLDDGDSGERSGSKSSCRARSGLAISIRLCRRRSEPYADDGTTMAAKYLDYYTSVADRMLPYLRGRQVAIEQQFPRSKGTVYRRHTGGSGDDTWIRIADRDALLAWARQHAVGLHAHIRSEDRGAWFVIDIDSREFCRRRWLSVPRFTPPTSWPSKGSRRW